MEKNTLWAIALLGIFLYLSSSSSTVIIQQSSNNNTNIGSLVNADVSFTGVNKYISGTALTGELVKVLRLNGVQEDLGTFSLNSGGLNVDPGTGYKFYFFMNATVPSTNFYVNPQDYTGKSQEATDNVAGQGCSIDSKPVVTVVNSAGQTQTASTNAQAVAANGNAEIEIEIKSHSDKCYGTPGASKGNSVCFNYNSNAFSDIKSNTNYITMPRSVNSLGLSNAVKCFDFDVLEDAGTDTLTIQLKGGSTEPTIAHNISIFTDDIGFDLNQNTLAEIWDFTDEDGNQLSRIINSTPDGIIYIN